MCGNKTVHLKFPVLKRNWLKSKLVSNNFVCLYRNFVGTNRKAKKKGRLQREEKKRKKEKSHRHYIIAKKIPVSMRSINSGL